MNSNNEIIKAIIDRRTIRQFTDSQIPKEDLDLLLECLCAAPSAGNLQAYEIYVVKDAKSRKRLSSSAYDQAFIAQAPVA